MSPSLARALRLVVGLLPLLAAAGACGPSVDPAAKADIDRRVALLGPPRETFAVNATTYQPPALAVGQWVQYKAVDDKGQPSFFTMKIVDEVQGAFTFEYIQESYTGRMITQMNMYLGDRTKLDAVDIRSMKMMDARGNVTELPPASLALMKASWNDMIRMVVVSWQGLPQEDASVPAGSFQGCYKARSDASFGPFKTASVSWSHPSVPVTGMVRSQGVDKPNTLELVAFGEKGGGKSEIP